MKKRCCFVAMLVCLLMLVVPAWSEDYGLPPVAPELELPSNPTTGYRWMYFCDEPEVLEVFENGFISDGEELLGAGGKESFSLYGCEEGTAAVTFYYARSWEDAPLYTLTCLVQVDGNCSVSIYQMELEMN